MKFSTRVHQVVKINILKAIIPMTLFAFAIMQKNGARFQDCAHNFTYTNPTETSQRPTLHEEKVSEFFQLHSEERPEQGFKVTLLTPAYQHREAS